MKQRPLIKQATNDKRLEKLLQSKQIVKGSEYYTQYTTQHQPKVPNSKAV